METIEISANTDQLKELLWGLLIDRETAAVGELVPRSYGWAAYIVSRDANGPRLGGFPADRIGGYESREAALEDLEAQCQVLVEILPRRQTWDQPSCASAAPASA